MKAQVKAVGSDFYEGIDYEFETSHDRGDPAGPYGKVKGRLQIWDPKSGTVDVRVTAEGTAELLGGASEGVDISVGGGSFSVGVQYSPDAGQYGANVGGEVHGVQVTATSSQFHIPGANVDAVAAGRLRVLAADASIGLSVDLKNAKVSGGAEAMASILQGQGILDTITENDQAVRYYGEGTFGVGGGYKGTVKWGRPPVESTRTRGAAGWGGGWGVETIDRKKAGEF